SFPTKSSMEIPVFSVPETKKEEIEPEKEILKKIESVPSTSKNSEIIDIPEPISCLKTLALNILKNASSGCITEGVETPELDPCPECNDEIFLYQLRKSFTVLACGHIFHRLCLENIRETITKCPVAEEGVSGGDANNYLYFFNKIDFAESKNIITNQEVIGSYFDFGGVLYKRYKDLKKDNGKEASNALVFEEVRKQIPKEVTDVALRKRMERVRKIYKLFTAIVNGNEKLAKDKIALIRSFSANSLSKLSQSDIDFVIVKILKKGK
ncbi:14982_t:CDS:2, partial [Entrophospora sp. SA101]